MSWRNLLLVLVSVLGGTGWAIVERRAELAAVVEVSAPPEVAATETPAEPVATVPTVSTKADEDSVTVTLSKKDFEQLVASGALRKSASEASTTAGAIKVELVAKAEEPRSEPKVEIAPAIETAAVPEVAAPDAVVVATPETVPAPTLENDTPTAESSEVAMHVEEPTAATDVVVNVRPAAQEALYTYAMMRAPDAAMIAPSITSSDDTGLLAATPEIINAPITASFAALAAFAPEQPKPDAKPQPKPQAAPALVTRLDATEAQRLHQSGYSLTKQTETYEEWRKRDGTLYLCQTSARCDAPLPPPCVKSDPCQPAHCPPTACEPVPCDELAMRHCFGTFGAAWTNGSSGETCKTVTRTVFDRCGNATNSTAKSCSGGAGMSVAGELAVTYVGTELVAEVLADPLFGYDYHPFANIPVAGRWIHPQLYEEYDAHEDGERCERCERLMEEAKHLPRNREAFQKWADENNVKISFEDDGPYRSPGLLGGVVDGVSDVGNAIGGFFKSIF